MSVTKKSAADNFLRGAELLKHKATMMTMAIIWSLLGGILAAFFFLFVSWTLSNDLEKGIWLTNKKAEIMSAVFMKNRTVAVCPEVDARRCWDVPANDVLQSDDFAAFRKA